MLSEVAKRPRFQSGNDRIRDTISNKAIRELWSIALDRCVECGWLHAENIGGRPGYTITERGRSHLQWFTDRSA